MQPYTKDLAQLQAQLDVFDHEYNTVRGHQSLEERRTPQEAWDAATVVQPPQPGEAEQHSTKPTRPALAGESVASKQETQSNDDATALPTKLSATLRVEYIDPAGRTLMRVNKNRCLRIAGVEIYLGKLLLSTPVHVEWDQAELMVISMEGELVAKFDYPFPNEVTYLSLKHATARFQNQLLTS